jgi:hypothetical protein
MKYRIYIDEVGNNDKGKNLNQDQRFLSLTGVVFNLDYVKSTLTPDLERLKTTYFDNHPDEPVIFHRKELINKKHPFKALINPKVEVDFNKELLALLEKWEFKVMTVLIDKIEHQNRYGTWRYDPYHYCLAILFERYHLRLKDIKQLGDMMVESRGGKEDLRLKEAYRKIFEEGTDWVKSEDIDETLTSKELKVKPKSANIAGLQIADLLAYPMYKFSLKHYGIGKEEVSKTFNDQILQVVKPKIFKNGNRMEGYGLKLLP